jgi:hypothetical protein
MTQRTRQAKKTKREVQRGRGCKVQCFRAHEAAQVRIAIAIDRYVSCSLVAGKLSSRGLRPRTISSRTQVLMSLLST